MTSTERSNRRMAQLRVLRDTAAIRDEMLTKLYQDLVEAGLLEWAERVILLKRANAEMLTERTR